MHTRYFRVRAARRRAILVFSTALVVLSFPWASIASGVDTAVVDGAAPTGEVTLSPGQSGTFIITLTVTGNQEGTATFKVNRNWSLSGGAFTGSNPETFTVPPRAGRDPAQTFTASGSVSVASGQSAGSFTLSVSAFDVTNSNPTGGKLAVGKAASYVVKVQPPADSTPPVITPSVSGVEGNNGWYTSNVVVSWSVTDPDSTVSSTTGCGTTTISSDTSGTTLTCSATSAGGTASKSVTVKRDATAPTLTATPSAAPNGDGWNNASVAVTYTCSDATSGLADSCPATDNATTDGTHTFSHVVRDKAGNSSSVSTTIKLDATKPTITGSASPAANGAGWNNSNVTVEFTCLDGGSGVKSCVADGTSPASDRVTLTGEGAGQSASGTATDNADNTNTATVSGINIDKTAPAIQLVSRTPANGNGWNDSDVTVTWSCTDPGGSGVVAATVAQTLSSNGAGQSTTGTCEDVAGNTASDTVGGINIDKSAPTITFFDRSPEANAAGWNNSDVTVTWTCADAVSDVVNGAVSGAVSTEGSNQSVTGTCEDLAGNTASDTQSGISIDKRAPAAPTAHVTPAANAAGWNNAKPVTVSFTSNGDSGPSGVSSCTSAQQVNVETAGQTVSGTCTDAAGNVSDPTSATVKIDVTKPNAPTLAATTTPAYGDWFKDSVTVVSTHNGDVGAVQSGVDPATVAVGQTFSTSGTHTATDAVEDVADNESDGASLTVKVDADKPSVQLSCPAGPVVLGSSASASWTASDGHSGLATPSQGTTSLSTATVGSKTATLPAGTAKDNVGHDSDAVSCTYSVVYGWNGFSQPINDTAHTGLYESKFRLGSTVPVKFVITDAAGLPVLSSTTPQFQVSGNRGACDTAGTQEAVPDTSASAGTAYKWTDGQYQYNFSTKGKTAGEYRVWATGLDDGVNHYVDLCLTR